MNVPANNVAVAKDSSARYPSVSPYHPDRPFPEYPFPSDALGQANSVYSLVRDCLLEFGLDSEHAGTEAWNPLGELVKPGGTVVVKPNLVLDSHPRGGELECLITHGSVVRALLDYVVIALKGSGRVVVGDSPLQGTHFRGAIEGAGLPGVIAWMQEHTDLTVDLIDFRQVVADMDERFHVRGWTEQEGDPTGYAEFELGEDSMLAPIAKDSRLFRVSNYRAEDTLQYHNEHSHRYVVAGSILDADLIVNVPKMKTHCKAGVTLGLKNFVGTVGRKQCLAHHRHGGHLEGGDEYPERSRLKRISESIERWIDGNPAPLTRKLLSFTYRVNERLIRMIGINGIRDGCWHGNDTVWRMVLDLVRIARFGRRDGSLADKPQRNVLTVVDGVVAGENEGPLEATPIQAGLITCGLSPVLVDATLARLMGFDEQKIPLLREALLTEASGRVVVRAGGGTYGLDDPALEAYRKKFVPAIGWIGHIEAGP